MSELKKLPLDALHRERGAKMVPFAGWDMPVQYTSILEEHQAVRTTAGLFDVSHMGEVYVEGPGAEAFLDYLLPNLIAGIPAGKAVYSVMCNAQGGAIDDLIVYRLSELSFLVCLNAANTEKDIGWMQSQITKFDCSLRDVSADYALLAFQGPKACGILERVIERQASVLPKRFRFHTARIGGAEVKVCGTGYTGELGAEFYCAAKDARVVAEALLEVGKAEGAVLAGLGARDSLRLEAGLPLYGHELTDTLGPLEAGLGWTVKFNKESDFVGKEALLKQKTEGTPRSVQFFSLQDRRIARQGSTVYAEGLPAGEVLSGSYSPILNQPIGSALLKTEFLNKGAKFEVDLRGKRSALFIQKPPLHLS